MKDTSKASLRRGHNEGNIRQRTDGRWEVRLSAGIDYKTGKPRRTSTCCNTRQEAIAILQQQAHEVRTQGWRDPMSVTLGEWYEYWLDTYMKDTVKQSTYASYRSYLNKHFCVLGKILLKKLEPHTLQEFYNYKFREEGLSPNTRIGLMLVYLSFSVPYAVWMLVGFFKTVPIGIEEAARIDGANKLQVFVRIVLPLVSPGIVATAIYVFINAWNEYLYSMILMSSSDKTTISVAVKTLEGADILNWGALMAACAIVVVPSIIFFCFIQNKMAGGLSDGAVK